MLFLQTMLTSDPEELDSRQKEHAAIMCVINFSNAVLSQELMNIVSKWVKTRNKLESVFPVFEKHRKTIFKISKWTKTLLPNVYLLLLILYANLSSILGQEGLVSREIFLYLINYLLIGFLGYRVVHYVGQYLQDHVEYYYHRASRFSILGITSGDIQQQNKSLANATKAMYKTSASITASLILNTVGGVLAAYICITYGITG
ncbi:hypothetical protein [Zhongshania sp.]|jgi:hypothetical protein|uniref:hypothetical protein n=1 Tax=Zhongshania sp. TaxID=1971902 RepID=UPI0039E59B3C